MKPLVLTTTENDTESLDPLINGTSCVNGQDELSIIEEQIGVYSRYMDFNAEMLEKFIDNEHKARMRVSELGIQQRNIKVEMHGTYETLKKARERHENLSMDNVTQWIKNQKGKKVTPSQAAIDDAKLWIEKWQRGNKSVQFYSPNGRNSLVHKVVYMRVFTIAARAREGDYEAYAVEVLQALRNEYKAMRAMA